ncbi:hypothetical protein [Solibacillus isronensis]|uniref:hypothetical protein n=1 Tax=Solibacillus isronensis TaxID=412383 RepID=UPI0009A8E52A|nr:hypothetical protein [Solibacillus isronensis]
MPYVTNFIFKHLEKETDKGSKMLQVIFLDSFPNKYSFNVQFTMVFKNNFVNQNGYLEIYRPDKTLLSKSASFIVSASEELSEEEKQHEDIEALTGVAYELTFKDIAFERPGVYVVKILCNEKSVAEFGITVASKESTY